jgi:catechol O-methyltransferase
MTLTQRIPLLRWSVWRMAAGAHNITTTGQMLINVGDEKGAFLDAAVQRANPKLALELGTYCGYGALRIARSAPAAKVYSVELAEANAANARQI